MSPDDAASVLGIAPWATRDEVEAAYARRARESHPDRFAGESAERVAAASREFIAVTDARAILLRNQRVVGPPTPRRPPTRAALRVWTALLLPGVLLELTGGGLPFPALLIVFPLVGLVAWLAATGSHRAFVLTALTFIALAILTVTQPNLGALLALLALQVPTMAVLILRRQ